MVRLAPVSEAFAGVSPRRAVQRLTGEAGGEALLVLGREGGHSARRVVHHRDTTGAEISRALVAAAARHPNITILEHHDAIDLLSWHKVDGTTGCFGCFALDVKRRAVEVFTANVTVLATGGCGKVYRYTSNPAVATGDGVAMAYRIGARVGNLEFMQFHPTCLHHPDAKSFLISEALRGEGGVLRCADGSELMKGRHPLESLAPRDVVAREIDAELKRSGERCVFLDMRHLDGDYVTARFPGIHARISALGIDMRKEAIPVVPAAHYMCGGVEVDAAGRTNIPGLMVIGEAALSGLHGACRLASNSLLEALVLADGAGKAAHDFGRAPPSSAARGVGRGHRRQLGRGRDGQRQLGGAPRPDVELRRASSESDKRLARARRRVPAAQRRNQGVLLALQDHAGRTGSAEHRPHRRSDRGEPADARSLEDFRFTVDLPSAIRRSRAHPVR